VVDRRLWVGDGRQADFDVVFGPGGIWRELLGRARGYIATETGCESPAERRYRVRDLWQGHRDFEVFRQEFAAEYGRFETLVSAEGLVEREQFVAAYYEKAPGNGGN
jgi:hypothetical protein